VSTVHGSNIITNYYDPNFPNATGPGLPPSSVVNQFNQPLGKPLNESAATPMPQYSGVSVTPPLGATPTTISTPNYGATYSVPVTSGYGATYTAPVTPGYGTTYAAPVTSGYGTTYSAPVTPNYRAPSTAPVTSPYGAALTTPITPSGSAYSAPVSQLSPLPAPARVQPAAFNAGVPPSQPGVRIGQPSHFEEPTYFFPGLVARLGRQWVGSDYLYQMPAHIGVVVEIVGGAKEYIEGQETPVTINAEYIKRQVMDHFIANGITPQAITVGNNPPLPFFHILIFAASTDDRGVAYITCRLFEKVHLDRFGFQLPGAWQAITWEKQELIITSIQQFPENVGMTAVGIADDFLKKVIYFMELRIQQGSDIKLKGAPKFAPVFDQNQSMCR